MRFWKGLSGTAKAGQYGTADDTGIVPDAVFCTQAEYDAWVSSQPAPAPSQLETDIANLTMTVTNVRGILQRLRQGER